MSGRHVSNKDKLAAAIAAFKGDTPRAELEKQYGASRQSILSWCQKITTYGDVVFMYGDPVARIRRLNDEIFRLEKENERLRLELERLENPDSY